MTEKKIREVLDKFAEEAKKIYGTNWKVLYYMAHVHEVILKMTVI